jgi:peptide chain release factor 1
LPSTAGSGAGGVFSLDLVEELPGLIVFRAAGKDADAVFRDEPGGHRWQRVPPGEKRGRIHTSTITVAVLPEATEAMVRLDPRALESDFCRGSGAGGQKRNKTESTAVIRHIPSGIVVRCESERSQHQNRATALSVLRSRLWAAAEAERAGGEARARRRQIGSGMRGDKRRTLRVQDGTVTDHVTGRRWSLRAYERGEW